MTGGGVIGAVVPGELLGPIVGLTFSADGDLLFACCGSFVRVFSVRSGLLLLSQRVFSPGAAVSGLDIGYGGSIGAAFGDKCVSIVDGVPTGSDVSTFATSADRNATGTPQRLSFLTIARLPELGDRVWDARLVRHESVDSLLDERREGGPEDQHKARGMGFVAVALAHNSVEVWDWKAREGPRRLSHSRAGDPCLLYHARLWGRTLAELKAASGTVFNQVLVWSPASSARDWTREVDNQKHGHTDDDFRWKGSHAVDPDGISAGENLLRLKGHEGVIFRICWRDDGKRVASVSDDQTVRVWDVEEREPSCSGNDISHGGHRRRDATTRGDSASHREPTQGRLLWTGWGHVSRVWDVGFSIKGIVTAGEDGTAILWREHHCGAADHYAEETGPLPAVPTPECLEQGGNHRTGGQLLQIAIMRGHSGSHVWRLAVHEGQHPEMVLLATGGNDGAVKLWDLALEASRQEISRNNTYWGRTDVVPSPAASYQAWMETPVGAAATASRPTTQSARTITNGCSDEADGESLRFDVTSSSAANAVREHRSVERNAFSTPPPMKPVKGQASVSAADRERSLTRDDVAGAGGRSGGIQQGRRRRQGQRPSVVRQVCLCPYGIGATVLFADGTLWWVSDLAVGTWSRVTEQFSRDLTGAGPRIPIVVHPLAKTEVSSFADDVDEQPVEGCQPHEIPHTGIAGIRPGTKPWKSWSKITVSGVTPEGRLLCEGVSAVAVVALRRGGRESNGGPFTSTHCGRCGAEGPPTNGDPNDVQIVVGRDDGWLFLLTQTKGYSYAEELIGGGAHCEGSGRALPWCVREAWKGHSARVTAIWPAGFHSTAGAKNGTSNDELPSHTAALYTSRLRASLLGSKSGNGFCGTIVSAAADGSLAWWEWTCTEGSVGNGRRCQAPRSSSQQLTRRMVCRAHPDAVVTSFAIDENCGNLGIASRDCSDVEVMSSSIPTTATGHGDRERACTPSPNRDVVFCGDIKGSIYCFMNLFKEGNESCSKAANFSTESVDGGCTGARSLETGQTATEGIAPCLILKRQHGKDQISRLALLGDCLLSAGHDGHVNHYLISYSSRNADSAGVALPVQLTLVTSYPTAPVTAISDMWVGRGKHWTDTRETSAEVKPCRAKLEKLKIAVAGRSGSMSMSVWDVIEGRQLLELECGGRHLAQHLVLSWPSASPMPARSIPSVRRPCAASGTLPTPPNTDNKGHNAAEPPSPLAECQPFGRVSDRFVAPAIPLHTAAFTRQVPASSDINSTDRRPAGHAGAQNDGGNQAKVQNLGTEQSDREASHPGFRLSFHSSIVGQQAAPLIMAGERDQGSLEACKGRARAAIQSQYSYDDSPPMGQGRKTACSSNADFQHTERGYQIAGSSSLPVDPGVDYPTTTKPVRMRFAYSLGEPFHGQRVTSVRFLPRVAVSSTVREGGGDCRHPSDVRLVTGSEDGLVKVLDVLYPPDTSLNDHADAGSLGVSHRQLTQTTARITAESTGGGHTTCGPVSTSLLPGAPQSTLRAAFRGCPYAKLVQTLPPHESSVGALAVGKYDGTSRSGGRQWPVIVSGGGKMELRAWCVAGTPKSSAGSGTELPEGEQCGSPPVRWLLTTCPAPRSPLHAHRIMCLFVLHRSLPPSDISTSTDAEASDHPSEVLILAGDSGGGISVHAIRNVCRSGGQERSGGGRDSATQGEIRSFPAGRWMSKSGRPVLCVAHARLTETPPPERSKRTAGVKLASFTVADLVITGDTAGTVTVWQMSSDEPRLPAGGGNREQDLGLGDESWEKRSQADVRGGFVHRGPEGRRRGATVGAKDIEETCIPRLFPVLEYRAHQMGVLCAAVRVSSCGRRLLVVTGGDDQAICVAEIEISCDETVDCFEYSQGQTIEAQERRSHGGNRAVSARLVGGQPDITEGAATSAIKGVALLSPVWHTLPAAGEDTNNPPTTAGGNSKRLVATVFAASRDQRLSGWHLFEVPTCSSRETAESRRPSGRSDVKTTSRRRGRPQIDENGSGESIASGTETKANSECHVQEFGSDSGEREDSKRHSGGETSNKPSDYLRVGQVHEGGGTTDVSTLGYDEGRREDIPRQRRWELEWKVGCVTDVCDVSDIDVLALPVEAASCVTPAAGYSYADYTTDRPHDNPDDLSACGIDGADVCKARGDVDRGGGYFDEAHEVGRIRVSPPALVAIAGQGLQLVLFGGDGGDAEMWQSER